MDTLNIKIAKDYSLTPGVREKVEGDFPGEEFLANILLPKFNEALAANAKLIIDMDDTAGYPTSFLEAAFGGLTRVYNADIVLQTIEFVSNDDPFLVEDIQEYINDAKNK